jgi:hypothetical protein
MTSLLKEIEQNINELIKLLLVEQAEFITAAEYDNGDDCLYDAPRVYTTSKHGYTNEWCVLRIDKGIVYLGGLFDDGGDFKQLGILDLIESDLLTIANNIY